jgi:mannose-6-phosphate isomerase-like protein (cupin superfamily)
MKNAEGKENSPVFDKRPWGTFTTLDEDADFKVKRIEVYPSKRLSYQKHAHRSEHWFVVRGIAKVTLNGEEFLLKNGDHIDIPVGTAHRVENPDAEQLLIFIETQTGDYFGEDDIERLEDDFGRIKDE